MENDPEIEKEDGGLLKQIQAILYSTEVCHTARLQQWRCRKKKTRSDADQLQQEGFEIPAEVEGEGELIEEETF